MNPRHIPSSLYYQNQLYQHHKYHTLQLIISVELFIFISHHKHKSMENNQSQNSIRRSLRQTMIRDNPQAGLFVRCISAIDIFSFIPVPKSKPVSTKCSLIGTAVFFIIFFTYIIYDLVTFIRANPPMPNSYYQKLDNKNYPAPNFSMVFMHGQQLEFDVNPTGFFNYGLKQNIKKQKADDSKNSSFLPCNQETANWMGKQTYNNYKQFLSCPNPSVPLSLGGLLYVSEYVYTPSIKVLQCYTGDPKDKESQSWCNNNRTGIEDLQSKGRLFLFIEVPEGSEYDNRQNDHGSYRLFNFFLVQGVYNRVNVQFQVNREVIMPDYLTRWTQKHNQWLQITTVNELNSNVVPIETIDSRSRLLSVDFTLNPSIKVTKVAYLTLIDHIAQWGALWGVQFAIFAIIFLSYNSKKYYKKNPNWENYDEIQKDANVINTMEL